MTLTYAKIAEAQQTIEDNHNIILKAFEDAKIKLETQRQQILTAIQQQQQREAAVLASIGDNLKKLVEPLEHQQKQV